MTSAFSDGGCSTFTAIIIILHDFFCHEFASIMNSYNFSLRETEKYYDRKGIINSNKHRICGN